MYHSCRLVTTALALAAAGAALVLAATAAASPATARRARVAGYTIVSADFTTTPGTLGTGRVECPDGTVAFSGGVEDMQPETSELVGSYPEVGGGVATGWIGEVFGDLSDTIIPFRVYVVCGQKPLVYAVASAAVAISVAAEADVSCPNTLVQLPTGIKYLRQMEPFGGGEDAAAVVDSTIEGSFPTTGPLTSGWHFQFSDPFPGSGPAEVYAICGLAPGWRVVTGTPVTVLGHQGTQASVSCFGGSGKGAGTGGPIPAAGPLQAIGGGFSLANDDGVYLGIPISTFPGPLASRSWIDVADTISSRGTTFTPYVVCLA